MYELVRGGRRDEAATLWAQHLEQFGAAAGAFLPATAAVAGG
jgi:hypothetical protein